MASYLATAIVAVGVLASTPEPLEWQADYGKALAATRAGDQPLLVVIDEPAAAESGAEPVQLDASPEGDEATELLGRYQLCHVNAATEYGKKVADAFKADKFPYTAIIDKTGSVIIFAKSGKMAANERTNTLEKHRDGERPKVHVSFKGFG